MHNCCSGRIFSGSALFRGRAPVAWHYCQHIEPDHHLYHRHDICVAENYCPLASCFNAGCVCAIGAGWWLFAGRRVANAGWYGINHAIRCSVDTMGHRVNCAGQSGKNPLVGQCWQKRIRINTGIRHRIRRIRRSANDHAATYRRKLATT